MKRLALDTSSVACTVALQIDGQLFERHEEQAREHTRLLIPMSRTLLQEAAVEIGDLDAIVLGNGPGSFIGMRIAASVAQGLAHGAGLNIVAVSSLAAVAAEVFETSDADVVAVAQDAHMSEMYLGLYARDQRDLPQLIEPERLHGVGHIAALEGRSKDLNVAAGEGWLRHPEQLAANTASLAGPPAVLVPRAKYLLMLSEGDSGVLPADIEPAYLRQEVAKQSRPATS